jgi:hypothetical protein
VLPCVPESPPLAVAVPGVLEPHPAQTKATHPPIVVARDHRLVARTMDTREVRAKRAPLMMSSVFSRPCRRLAGGWCPSYWQRPGLWWLQCGSHQTLRDRLRFRWAFNFALRSGVPL